MLLGAPVVAAHVGGVPDMVIDGISGWLVPTGDQAGLNRILGEALRDPAECARRGERAREEIATRFSVEGCVQAHENLYAAALRSRDPAPRALQPQAA
jgi:glycosyltransferase involved in cell wall biosynthesis